MKYLRMIGKFAIRMPCTKNDSTPEIECDDHAEQLQVETKSLSKDRGQPIAKVGPTSSNSGRLTDVAIEGAAQIRTHRASLDARAAAITGAALSSIDEVATATCLR